MEKNKWKEVFDSFLESIDFELIKHPRCWALKDTTGTNLGEIENDRFCNAAAVLDRLDIYIQDYVAEVEAALTSKVTGWMNWQDMLAKARKELTPEQQEHWSYVLDALDMICNHAQDIDLEKCTYTIAGWKDLHDEHVCMARWMGTENDAYEVVIAKKDALNFGPGYCAFYHGVIFMDDYFTTKSGRDGLVAVAREYGYGSLKELVENSPYDGWVVFSDDGTIDKEHSEAYDDIVAFLACIIGEEMAYNTPAFPLSEAEAIAEVKRITGTCCTHIN